MGSVWLASHLDLDTPLAIKFIDTKEGATAEIRGRFEREAKAAALLHGPNVVQILDYGVDDGTPYIVMELLHGEDLSTRLAREGRLSLPVAANVVNQVAKVLRRAHEAGIVHRDLKPSNIYIVQSDDEDEPIVKVLDFGVAKAPKLGIGGDATKTGTLIGSPRYMSPEQARASRNVDPRSDLWSLAVIAFRAVTGQLPFIGDEIGEVLLKICTEPAPEPSSIEPDLPPEIDRFFERAFHRDLGRRFQTARELASEFAIAAGLPPPSMTILGALPAVPRTTLDAARASLVSLAAIEEVEVDPEPEGESQPSTAVAGRPVSAPALLESRGLEPTRRSAEPPSRLSVEPAPSSAPPSDSPEPATRSSEQPAVSEERVESAPELSWRTPGTLTGAPGSVDVLAAQVASAASARHLWGGAVIVAALGLVLGGALAMQLLLPSSARAPAPTLASTLRPSIDSVPVIASTVVPAALAAPPEPDAESRADVPIPADPPKRARGQRPGSRPNLAPAPASPSASPPVRARDVFGI